MEYTVILTQPAVARWRATVPALPDCSAEAPTRAEVLGKIRERIISVARQTEVLRLQVPVTPQSMPIDAETPWRWFGAFHNDATWDTLFDHLEQQREDRTLGA
jgi:hypothetical protein